MRPALVSLLCLTPALILAGLGCSPADPPPGPPDRVGLRIGVTVPPQAYLVERLGGERVATEVLMPSGSSEETFSPSPRQMVALARADLYFLVGHPAFLVETRHVAPALARNPAVRVVSMTGRGEALEPPRADHDPHDPRAAAESERAGPGGPAKEAVEYGHAHGGGAGDPHLWTAPGNMRRAAVEVAAALAELDPAGAPAYRSRLATFLADLDALDAEVRRELSDLPRRRFLVTHPAWGHFAAEYGLEQVAIEQEGKEPGPRRLVALVEAARTEGIRTVFSQRGFPEASARAVAAELGAEVIPLDPLARDWLENTRKTAQALATALKQP